MKMGKSPQVKSLSQTLILSLILPFPKTLILRFRRFDLNSDEELDLVDSDEVTPVESKIIIRNMYSEFDDTMADPSSLSSSDLELVLENQHLIGIVYFCSNLTFLAKFQIGLTLLLILLAAVLNIKVLSDSRNLQSIDNYTDGCSIYIKVLSLNATTAQLEEEFKKFGPIY